jgi:hypothetical protein
MRVEITDAVEAFLVMEAVQAAAMNELIASAQRGPKGEDAEIRSKVLQRVASRIADEFIPDPRRVILEDEIEFGIV